MEVVLQEGLRNELYKTPVLHFSISNGSAYISSEPAGNRISNSTGQIYHELGP